MRCLSSRRLTGPNLIWDRCGAVLDVEFGDDDPDTVIATWERLAQRMLAAVSWEDHRTSVRRLSAGASLAISAPLDCLYSVLRHSSTEVAVLETARGVYCAGG